jgi:hypothetical protein
MYEQGDDGVLKVIDDCVHSVVSSGCFAERAELAPLGSVAGETRAQLISFKNRFATATVIIRVMATKARLR